MADHPVGSRKPSVRAKQTEYVGKQRFLVRNMDQRILGEDEIEAFVAAAWETKQRCAMPTRRS
jgi:hypothetical protein